MDLFFRSNTSCRHGGTIYAGANFLIASQWDEKSAAIPVKDTRISDAEDTDIAHSFPVTSSIMESAVVRIPYKT
ncbi:hypothetical protein [Yersinia frederiksenii]|uniref:hypothetical protein n=1 Tax=Yersinia TaxID=629 RepID=UPI001CFEB2D3|nr:hypothetical protein [Yersinia massiliensis]